MLHLLLRLGTFTLLTLLFIIPGQPQRRKDQKADASANRAGIVRPRRTQETWITIVSRWDDWYRRARLQRRPATTAMVENKFEHAVSVGNPE